MHCTVVIFLQRPITNDTQIRPIVHNSGSSKDIQHPIAYLEKVRDVLYQCRLLKAIFYKLENYSKHHITAQKVPAKTNLAQRLEKTAWQSQRGIHS